MAAVRASSRVSIAWSGAPAFEDTDTLVLTINGWSLDLRVFTSGPDSGKIDWSTVAHVKELEGSTSANPILQWQHLIDSRPPTDMEDQGVFATLPNGDVTETGIMHNPKNGQYEDYIETWRRYVNDAGAPYCVLERVEEEGSAEHVYLGRVGIRALGLAKLGDGNFLARRGDYPDGTVKRIYQFGDRVNEVLPSLPVEMDYQTGSQVELGGQKWIVRTAGHLS